MGEASQLDYFLKGTKWSPEHARRSLPVLVRWIEQHIGKPDEDIPDFTYTDLAIAVGQPNHAHPIHESLGILGFALQALNAERPELGSIPPIQLLVWSKGEGSPGDDGFNFVKIGKTQLSKMSKAERQFTARRIRAQIMNYPKWRQVLIHLELRPLTVDLPTVEEVITSPIPGSFGGPESEAHKRLKEYLAAHPESLGIVGKVSPSLEVPLLSGDFADLIFDQINPGHRYCIEVKSRISPDTDIVRGVFQCIKYLAVLTSQEKYESLRSEGHIPKEIHVMLVTEREPPNAICELAKHLEVPLVRIIVPTQPTNTS